ncbi:hypothetical protein Q3G72_009794 [Acer saccharum]|nr:hypothetical protein Q3G72_009794 [Acer saccharum]
MGQVAVHDEVRWKPESSVIGGCQVHILVLEEVKFLQKQRERKSGIPALTTALQSGAAGGGSGGGGLTKEKRLMGRMKSEFSIPSSYSADYFQRCRDYAEKLRREHPELYKDRGLQDNGAGPKGPTDISSNAAGNRQAATDQFMLERFRNRECSRGMRRYMRRDHFPRVLLYRKFAKIGGWL